MKRERKKKKVIYYFNPKQWLIYIKKKNVYNRQAFIVRCMYFMF